MTLRVRVIGEDGGEGAWSEPRRIFAGFLGDGEWSATTIGLANPQSTAQPAYLRTEFDVSSPVARATLYATAVGVYQAALNGEDVDDQVMKPGWTSFQYRTIHETTDVTDLIREGRNAIGVRLAGAWGTERFGFRENARLIYGDQPRFAAQLLIEYAGRALGVGDDGCRVARVDRTHHRERALRRRALRRAQACSSTPAGRGIADAGFDDSAWSAAAGSATRSSCPKRASRRSSAGSKSCRSSR